MKKHQFGPILLFLGVAALCVAAVVVPSLLSGCSSSACKDPQTSGASAAGCAAENAAVSCLGGSATGAIAKYGPLVSDILAHAPKAADGSTDYSAIEGSLVDAGIKYGECVVADVFSKLIADAIGALKVGSGSASSPTPPPAAKVFFDKFRAAHLGGHRFTTSQGEI